MDENKKRALSAALGQIEKQFGKGSVMRMGDKAVEPRGGHRHRLADARHRARHRRPAQGPRGRNLWSGILGQDHADAAGHRAVPEGRRHRRLHRRRARARSDLRAEARRQHRRPAGLAAGHRRAGAGNRRHAGAFQCGGHGGGRLGRRADAQGRDRGRDGRPACRPAGAPDEPGAAQAHRQHQALATAWSSSSTSCA